MKKIKKHLIKIALLFLFVIVGYGYLSSHLQPEIDTQPYPEFEIALEAGDVKEVVILLDAADFKYVNQDEEWFRVSNPKTENFKLILLENGVDVTETKDNTNLYFNIASQILSFVSIVLIALIILSTVNKTIGGKKDNKVAILPETKLKDIAGMREVKKDISILIEFLKNPKLFTEKGAKMPRGIIFYGDPGTGKTMLAKAIAGEAGVPFFSIAGSDFVEMFVGLGAKRVRELFQKARASGPCIVFIDELDAVGSKRGKDSNSEKDQTINALLAELDGFSTKDEILVIAATNRLDDLDSALIRSGRFDKHIKIPLPLTKDERRAIIDIHKVGKSFDETADFNQLARMTIGLSGADIANILNESVIDSIMLGKEKVDGTSLDNAFYKVILRGHRKEAGNSDKSAHETRLIAYHEAGHAIVARLLCRQSVPMVTIIGTTTGAGGFTISLPENMGIVTVDELENKVEECYAGRAAEEIAGFARSTGASNDIEKATSIISKMHTTYGMYNSLINTQVLAYGHDKSAEHIEEVKETANELYKRTLTFLLERKSLLQGLAEALIEKETMDEKELDALIEALHPRQIESRVSATCATQRLENKT